MKELDLTKTERAILGRASQGEQPIIVSSREENEALDRLRDRGLLTPFPFHGLVITTLGRQALAEGEPRAMTKRVAFLDSHVARRS